MSTQIQQYIAASPDKRQARILRNIYDDEHTAIGAVTQATSRATGVTLNSLRGTITTSSASLAAESSAVFVVTNSQVAIDDVVVACIRSGAIALNTDVIVTAVAAGSFSITVVNGNVAAGTAETGAIIINFRVIKGAVL